MSIRSFKLSEIDRQSGCREIQVEGELDMAVADQLQDCLDRVGAEHATVLIDLKGCEFIDSAGIAVIVHAHNRMSEQGRRLVVCAASDQVLRVLSVTGLTGNGLVFESAEQALAPAEPSAGERPGSPDGLQSDPAYAPEGP